MRYEYAITPSRNITYNAPGGYHDDCVIALALSNSDRNPSKEITWFHRCLYSF